ncbi:hypothetical protein [Crocinitomix algicola]|uniref:hypothetical protein n=1 Tax=Crocinitomix algicola TaxID=1740263 RepID=UPI0008722363|nr:hypothetical protein [Crocinitomix algicola]
MKEQINISNRSDDSGSKNDIVLKNQDRLARRFLLKDKRIGISISECEDLEELGFDINHLRDAMIETAKYVLSLGGSLAYGGDLRNGGFTELFFDLLNYYNIPESNEERFYSYLAWPLSLNLTKKQRAELASKVTFIPVDPPADIEIKDLNEFLPPSKGKNQYIWTRCLTEMRDKMNLSCDARIFIGGKTSGFKGKYPGVLEEFVLSLKKKQPIFLIGAFGGVTMQIIESLENRETSIFNQDYMADNEDYQELITLFEQNFSENTVSYSKIKEEINNLGWDGISSLNGLTVSQNKRLATTPHISEIIYLILLGLTQKFS